MDGGGKGRRNKRMHNKPTSPGGGMGMGSSPAQKRRGTKPKRPNAGKSPYHTFISDYMSVTKARDSQKGVDQTTRMKKAGALWRSMSSSVKEGWNSMSADKRKDMIRSATKN